MRDQVASSKVLSDDGIVHAEIGEIVVDGLVPIEFSFVDEGAEFGDDKGFGHRSDAEEGIRRDGELFIGVAVAVTFGEDHFAVPDHGDGQAGDFPVFHGLSDEIVEAVEGRFLRGEGNLCW